MKKIIFRKIALDCLNFFLVSLFSVGMIIWVLQAVNFLDIMIEDGHGIFVYLNYTLLNIPKIVSKIFPFVLFFSFYYILLKYENNNELVIFWNYGIHKKKFINFFLCISLVFLILQMILTTFAAPMAQDKARSYIRNSDIDLFESIIKPKKFIDTAKDLTIFVNEKTANGVLKHIFLKDNLPDGAFQITFAKRGKFIKRGNRKILQLFDGKTINNNNNGLSGFEFSKTDFDISKFNSKSTSSTKTQENSTLALINCSVILKNLYNTNINANADLSFKANESLSFNNCRINNTKNIISELYKRIIQPFYIPILILIALLLILKSKDEHDFKSYKFKIFLLGVFIIIFSEISQTFISSNLFINNVIVLLPFIIFIYIYIYTLGKLKILK